MQASTNPTSRVTRQTQPLPASEADAVTAAAQAGMVSCPAAPHAGASAERLNDALTPGHTEAVAAASLPAERTAARSAAAAAPSGLPREATDPSAVEAAPGARTIAPSVPAPAALAVAAEGHETSAPPATKRPGAPAMEPAPRSMPQHPAANHAHVPAPSRACIEARDLASALAAALSSAPVLLQGARQRSPTTARPYAAANLSRLQDVCRLCLHGLRWKEYVWHALDNSDSRVSLHVASSICRF